MSTAIYRDQSNLISFNAVDLTTGLAYAGATITNSSAVIALSDGTTIEPTAEIARVSGSRWKLALSQAESNQASAYGFLSITGDEIEPVEIELMFFDSAPRSAAGVQVSVAVAI